MRIIKYTLRTPQRIGENAKDPCSREDYAQKKTQALKQLPQSDIELLKF